MDQGSLSERKSLLAASNGYPKPLRIAPRHPTSCIAVYELQAHRLLANINCVIYVL